MPNSSLNKILHYQFIQDIFELPFVEVIYLFGSRARGDYQERSDIDLAISCSHMEGKDWSKVMTIIENADTLLKVDCVHLEQANLGLKEKIMKEGVVLYDKHKNGTKAQ